MVIDASTVQSGKKSAEEHELAEKIRESGQAGNVSFLCGYIGKADSEKIVRLYIDVNFDCYVDIPKDSIIHTVTAPDNVLPFDGKCVWISRDTQLSRVDASSTRRQARFLEGRISKRYLTPEAAEPTGRADFVRRIRRAAKSDYCSVNCTTDLTACHTLNAHFCITMQMTTCPGTGYLTGCRRTPDRVWTMIGCSGYGYP